jgi:GGDEF domain-containing protein
VSVDLFTITLVTALVIVVCAVLYLTETLMRKDVASGRLWAVAFLAGVFTVACYLVWSVDQRAFLAVALGNGGFVSTAGFIWLGARAFNGRRVRVAGGILAAIAAIVIAAALIAGPDGGDWAGAVPMFAGNAVLAVLGAVETRRGQLAAQRNAVGLTAVLILEAAYFVARAVVFLTQGPDSSLFQQWFDSRVTSILTITLTIVAVVTTSVLRAGESQLRGQRETYAIHVALDGILTPASFRSTTTTLLERAQRNGETMCVVAMRLDDLGRVAVAFGPGEAEALAGAWRAGVRRHAPSAALVGEGAGGALFSAFLTTSFSDVRRTASILHRRLLEDFGELGLSVMPVVGVGIALTDRSGYDYRTLVAAADDAARRSASSPDASVILADG